jgi:hypothetical protein
MRPAFFVTSIDLPLIAQPLEASPSEPYVGMTLKLDRMQIAQLILDSQLPSLNSGFDGLIQFTWTDCQAVGKGCASYPRLKCDAPRVEEYSGEL